MICCEGGNITALTKIENFTFDPYKVNPAVNMYRDLSYTINKLFGHDVKYARATPLANGRDFTLKEWTLYDVEEPECFKLLVPNNEFPDNKINFGPYGLDFEMPFEVHIVKQYFEDKFTKDMNWDLFLEGKIHIDHIIPLAKAKTEEDVYTLCHYTNLQPLWAIDNLKKGSKII